MKISNLTLKLLLFNLFMVSLPAIGYVYGITQTVYAQDQSHLTVVLTLILAACCIGSVFVSIIKNDFYSFVRFMSFVSVKVYLYIGLMGTIYGLYSVLSLLKGTNGTLNPSELSLIFTGLSTVFFPTLVGIFSRVWTECLIFIFRRHEIQEV